MARKTVRSPQSTVHGKKIKNSGESGVYAVVLIGGKGKRLRPLSTPAKPKAFLAVTADRKTMFRRTVERIAPLAPLARVIVVANKAHLRHVHADLPGIRRENLLLEPVSRNTAPAVALAAFALERRGRGDAIILMLPADQYILDEKERLASIRQGIAFLRRSKEEPLIVLGVKPESPSTHYGYVKVGSRVRGSGLGGRAKSIYVVDRFVEKPDAATAARYLKSGGYLWNTGAFLFTARALLAAISMHAPAIYEGLAGAKDLGRAYRRLPDISIDYAVMEKASPIYCVKGSYRWIDMGSFEALRTILIRELRPFVEKDGKIIKVL